MALDRKALLARVRESRDNEIIAVKHIEYQLPTESGSTLWSPYSLIAKAEWLMVGQKVSDSLRGQFVKEAAVSIDIRKLLATIDRWFTVTVRSEDYTPLAVDIVNYYDSLIEDSALDEALDGTEEAEEDIDTALESFDEAQATRLRDEEITRKADEMIRKELGLGPNERVVIKVIRTKPVI